METLIKDIRHGLRSLLKHRGFTAIAVLTLALGIGANTAIFSLVNIVLVRPAPYQNPDHLVLVKESLPKLGWFDLDTSAAEFLDYKESNEVFSGIAGFTSQNMNLTGIGEPQRVQAERVSADLFPLLGVQPLHGRTFSEEEDQPGRNNVVILSYGLWQRDFGSDFDVIGKTITLDDRTFTVIGVMPPRFEFPYTRTSFAKAAALWIPLALTDQEKRVRASDLQYGVLGRLEPGVTLPQAQAKIAIIAARFQQQHPDIYREVQISATVVDLQHDALKKVKGPLLLLMVAVGLILMIACANVANLLTTRAVVRQRELVIRSALGAGAGRIVRQLLTESMLLSFLGGASGLLLGVWIMNLLVRYGSRDLPSLQNARLDPQVLGFTLLTSLLAGILCGLAPAFQSSRLNLNQILKDADGRTSSGREGKRIRNLLVIFETAAAVVLLIGAGLLINSFARILRVPPGFDPQGVVIAQTALPAARYQKPEERKKVQKQVLERLAALPGVQAAGLTTNLPLVGERGIGFIIEGDATQTVNTSYNAWVSNDYFRALGIQLKAGRNFNDQDREDTPPVVVINETMQRRFWPQGDAIGKRVQWGGWSNSWLTIVGVVADVKVSSLERETEPAIYMPIFQIPRARDSVIYVLRSVPGTTGVATALRREIRTVDPEMPVFDVRTMEEVLADSVSQRRFSMLLLAVFAAAAILLAAIGLYGVMSFTVAQRTHEIGMRMALGAQTWDVLRLVVKNGMTLALIGVAIGLAAAFALTRLMESLLFGVSATDPTTFSAIAIILVGVALLACYIPARRATKVDPLVALRYE